MTNRRKHRRDGKET